MLRVALPAAAFTAHAHYRASRCAAAEDKDFYEAIRQLQAPRAKAKFPARAAKQDLSETDRSTPEDEFLMWLPRPGTDNAAAADNDGSPAAFLAAWRQLKPVQPTRGQEGITSEHKPPNDWNCFNELIMQIQRDMIEEETKAEQEKAEERRRSEALCSFWNNLMHEYNKTAPFQVVALDLDGTLLSSQHKVPPETSAALQELERQGVGFILATGRSHRAIREHIASLNLQAAPSVVALNGASVQHRGKVIRETRLNERATDAALTLAKILGLAAQYYVNDDIYVVCTKPNHYALCERYSKLTGVKQKYVKSYDKAKARGLPFKILLMTDDPDSVVAATRNHMAHIYDQGQEPWKVIGGSPAFFVELLDPKINKGRGLEQLLEYRRIPKSQVVGFGDGNNDVEFLQVCGLGVAMKNASENLKASLKPGDRITKRTNDQGGVVDTLRELREDGLLGNYPLREPITARTAEDQEVIDALWAPQEESSLGGSPLRR